MEDKKGSHGGGIEMQRIKSGLAVFLLLSVILCSCGASDKANENIIAEEGERSSAGTRDPAVLDKAGTKISLPSKKEETVYIDADANGNIKEINDEIILKIAEVSDFIKDVSSLTDIKNTKGDEEYIIRGNEIYWENHGEDIEYKGKTAAEIPVSVNITYFLDGKEISPEKLAGKSGDVRMRFEYENHTNVTKDINGNEVNVHIPFMANTIVMLPSDIFTDIDTDGGKLMSMGDDNVVLGTVYPGLSDDLMFENYELTKDIEMKEYMEITAHAEGFELDFTATVLSLGLFSDVEDEDLSDIEEKADDMDELKDGIKDMRDGADDLYDAVDEMDGYVDDLSEAATKFRDATQVLLYEAMPGVNSGVDKLYDGSRSLTEGMNMLIGALGATSVSSGDAGNMAALANSNDPTTKAVVALVKDMAMLEAMTKNDPTVSAQVSLVKKDVIAILGILNSGNDQLTEGLKKIKKGVNEVFGSMVKFNEAAEELLDATDEMEDGMDEFLDAADEIKDAVYDFDEEEITKLADDNLISMVRKIRAYKLIEEEYDNFSGKPEGAEGEIRFIIETEEIKK